MEWMKTLGIFLRGLFAFLNNPDRYEWKDAKWEVKKPVKEAKAKNKVEKLEDKGQKRNNRRDKKAAPRAKRYKKK